MEIQEYISQKKELYDSIQNYIENEDEPIEFADLEKIFEKQHISKNPNDLRLLLHLIAQVSKNHHRSPGFNDKLTQILSHFAVQIKQTFTNLELFEMFKRSKLILLFLIEKKIITIDERITHLILNKKVQNKQKNESDDESENESQKSNPIDLSYYLYPEIKEFLDSETREKIEKNLLEIDSEIFESFDQKRHEGENHSVISQLIRKNLVDEFIPYININKISPSSKLSPSIFETNPLLIKFEPTLIEYAAFFGSIEIFQFLEKSRVKLSPSLWLYAIHSKNPQIIHFLEDNHVEPPGNSYFSCLKEAIKCHHNDFANYIKDNLLTQSSDDKNKKEKKIENDDENENELSCGFCFYNFPFIQNFEDEKNILFYSCKFDYITIVDILLKGKKFVPNELMDKDIYIYIYFIKFHF